MARDHARVNLAIWGDPDFRALPPLAQHLYLLLWTSPELTYVGAHDWRPSRISGRAGGWSAEHVQVAADCLAARHFLVIDGDTEEALIRSWIRWDGLLKQPRMAISCVKAYASIASSTLRSVVAHQLQAERERMPDLSCWRDGRVLDVLSHPAVSAKDLPTPKDPFGGGFTPALTPLFGPGLAQTQGDVYPSVYTPRTTATSTTTSLHAVPDADASGDAPKKSPRRKPERPLPESWKPNDRHRELAAEGRLNLEREATAFRNHADTHDRRARDWDAAFRTWLGKSTPTQPAITASLEERVNQW